MSFWDLLSDNLPDLVGAGLNVAGGVAGYKAAKTAAKAQRQAAESAQAQFRPYAQLGDQAAGEMRSRLNKNALLGDFTLQDFQADPGYNFRLSEGNKAIDRAAGARGSRYSGATLKAMQRFAQGLASDEFQRAYDRDANNRTMQYNFLAGPINAGQGASGTIANYMGNAGDARAAGTVGAASNLWGGLSDAYNTFQTNRYLRNSPYTYLLPGA